MADRSHANPMAKPSTAIKKLKELLADKDKPESISSLAKKIGIARGTLLGILSGTSVPRLDMMTAAKKVGIKMDDWS
jgi:DNA-binding phage protein